MLRCARWVAAASALAAPVAASAVDLQIEGFYGIERPPTTSFNAAVSGVGSASHLFNTSLQLAGGDILLNLAGFEFGAIADTTFGHDTASQTAIGGLAGLGLHLGSITKLDLLFEAGGHRYGNFVKNPDIVTSSSPDQWLAYVGLRPGVSFRVAGPLALGVWAFVRWDVQTHHEAVTVAAASASGTYKLGGTSIGATARLGFDF